MTLTHRPFHLKTHAKPVFFAVFAKSFGAGVGLGMNSTSMELEGTGVQQPLGTRVAVSGTAPALQSYPPDRLLLLLLVWLCSCLSDCKQHQRWSDE